MTIKETCKVYAVMALDNFTLTFDLGNGRKVSSLVTFNDTIVYPENVTRKWHSFKGWSDTVDRMPGYDLTIRAIWARNRLPALIDAFIAASCFVSVCAVLMVAVSLFAHREGRDESGYNLNSPLEQFSVNLKETL